MGRDNGSDDHGTEPLGPRGGTTTVTRTGMVKKNLWIPREMAEKLRTRAFDEHRSEAELIRQGLELLFGESE